MSCIKDGAFQPVAIPPPPTHFENSLRSSPLLEVGDSRKKIVDDIVKELCKPIYWRVAVNPIIRRAVIAALFTSILFSITPSGLFASVAFCLMLLVSTSLIVLGIFELEILIIGAALDLINSLKISKTIR
jgi:hypothetical protein